MSEKEPKRSSPSKPSISKDPFLGIDPKFTLKRGEIGEPNSGPEYNPVLEREIPLWSELAETPTEGQANQQETEDLREEQDAVETPISKF